MSSSAFALAAAAAKIDTVAQVRAAMGAVTTTLAQGYAIVPSISTVADMQATAQSLLDGVNRSATALYNVYTDDPDLQDEEISTLHAHQAGVIMSDANDALKLVEDASSIKFDVASVVDDALTTVGATVGTGLQSITNAVAAGASAFVWSAWPTLLIVGGLGAAYLFRRQLLGALGKAAA